MLRWLIVAIKSVLSIQDYSSKQHALLSTKWFWFTAIRYTHSYIQNSWLVKNEPVQYLIILFGDWQKAKQLCSACDDFFFAMLWLSQRTWGLTEPCQTHWTLTAPPHIFSMAGSGEWSFVDIQLLKIAAQMWQTSQRKPMKRVNLIVTHWRK